MFTFLYILKGLKQVCGHLSFGCEPFFLDLLHSEELHAVGRLEHCRPSNCPGVLGAEGSAAKSSRAKAASHLN